MFSGVMCTVKIRVHAQRALLRNDHEPCSKSLWSVVDFFTQCNTRSMTMDPVETPGIRGVLGDASFGLNLVGI